MFCNLIQSNKNRHIQIARTIVRRYLQKKFKNNICRLRITWSDTCYYYLHVTRGTFLHRPPLLMQLITISADHCATVGDVENSASTSALCCQYLTTGILRRPADGYKACDRADGCILTPHNCPPVFPLWPSYRWSGQQCRQLMNGLTWLLWQADIWHDMSLSCHPL